MKRRYPLLDIGIGKKEEKEVLEVLRSKWLSTGPVTDDLNISPEEEVGYNSRTTEIQLEVKLMECWNTGRMDYRAQQPNGKRF